MPEQVLQSLYIPNVMEATALIRDCYNKKDYSLLNNVMEYINDPKTQESIAGTADEFHNASVRLVNDGFYELAYNILSNIGIKRNPCNTDLLGDLLTYGMRCRDLDALRPWYDQLATISKRFWTWRAYQFSFDYLMETLPYTKSEDELLAREREIESIFSSFKDNFRYLKDKSDREKAYMMEYEFYASKGEEKRALEALENGVKELPNKCAQCALKYADHQFEVGNYIDAAKYARIAVEVKEDQPSINIGYTYYILAMSLEQLARKENSINAESEVQSIYSAYYSAYQYMEHGREHLKKSIRRQVMSLEFESKIPSNIDFSRIDKETDAETVNSINGLLKLLSDSDKE